MSNAKTHKKPRSKRPPYSKAQDDEKVSRNWRKARKLYERGECSVAVIRCGTCIELAVNFAIRKELVETRDLPLSFVDGLLKSANGLRNKYFNIFLPIMAGHEKQSLLKNLWNDRINKINNERNSIVHSGEFRSKQLARPVMEHTLAALHGIMDLYKHSAALDGIKT